MHESSFKCPESVPLPPRHVTYMALVLEVADELSVVPLAHPRIKLELLALFRHRWHAVVTRHLPSWMGRWDEHTDRNRGQPTARVQGFKTNGPTNGSPTLDVDLRTAHHRNKSSDSRTAHLATYPPLASSCSFGPAYRTRCHPPCSSARTTPCCWARARGTPLRA